MFVRERECVCDFSFLFFYGHFGPKHLWTTGDNLNASYIRRIIIHPSTIIFFIDKEDLPRGRCGGGYEEGNETVSRGNPITEIHQCFTVKYTTHKIHKKTTSGTRVVYFS